MMLRIAQFVWLLPVTVIFWIFHVLPMWLFRGLRCMGWADWLVVEFVLREDAPFWYAALWRRWGGMGGPCCFIRRQQEDPLVLERLRKHELAHCRQQFVWGILYYPAYIVVAIAIYFFQRDLHPYLDHPFEVAARREAGQPIQVPRGTDRWPWW